MIWRTASGIPHIMAQDLGGAAFGQGYAFAQDHFCALADQINKVRGERARYLGAGPNDAFVGSDFAYLALALRDRAQAAFAQQPADVQSLIEGFAAGYNKYLSDTGLSNLPGGCANAPWVRPIDTFDLMAYHLDLTLKRSSTSLIPAIAAAQPPSAPPTPLRPTPRVEEGRRWELGSNGWAIGAQRSHNGHGMLLANPHFPWEGDFRFWESHLVVPYVLDIYGASLLGERRVQQGRGLDTYGRGWRTDDLLYTSTRAG